ncbi:MAG: ATP-binding protein [Elusimicrobiota bacterium]
MTTHNISRTLDLAKLLKKKSYFLLGPRQTGKSFLIKQSFGSTLTYNLLDTTTYLNLAQNPKRLEQEITAKTKHIIIDEIQRLPQLLNEVHLLIEEHGIHFLLTGSSARKLRKGGVNLLGGRARTKYLHPFTYKELKHHFNLQRALHNGLIPSIYFSDDPDADLVAYNGTYLKEEIIAEGVTRNIPAFSRFLQVASYCNGSVMNFTNIASDAQVPRTTVYEYFDILKDTLIMKELPAWDKSIKRKPLVSSKYYFFDVGVVRSLQKRIYNAGTPEFGEAFETYLFHELSSYVDYQSQETLSFWRSSSGFEVDFILGDHTAIEVKAKKNVSEADLKGLRAISEEKKFKKYFCVSLESRPRKVGNIDILPYQSFLDELYG